jgi:hypothetical protein
MYPDMLLSSARVRIITTEGEDSRKRREENSRKSREEKRRKNKTRRGEGTHSSVGKTSTGFNLSQISFPLSLPHL